MTHNLVILGNGGLADELAARFSMWLPTCVSAADEPYAIKHCRTNQMSRFLIGVGTPALRWRIWQRNPGLDWFTENGSLCLAGVQLTSNVALGWHVLLNLNVTVGHDTKIGDCTVVNPGANISGNVTIGKRVLIGTGACIREGVRIGDDAVIGMGSVVLHDVPAGMTVVGNPAKILYRDAA